MSKVFLCKAGELPVGEMKKIANPEVGDICVYNLDGVFYATADLCTHATASLAEGDVEDDLITCPVHWGQFHIPSGKAVTFPCERDLRTYRVEVEQDEVYADLSSEAIEAIEGANSPV